MGRKKGKNRQNQQNKFLASPASGVGFQDLGSPNLDALKNPNLGEEVEIPLSEKAPINPYKTVYLSAEDVELAKDLQGTSEKKPGSRGSRASNSSSYHDLIDGGAYNQFRSSHQSLNRSSKMDFESAGDRVMSGSRSISHRSLFNDDRSFGGNGGMSYPKSVGSKISLVWEDMKNDDDGQVRITRDDRARGISTSSAYEETMRKPIVRGRTLSSGGSIHRNSTSSNGNNNLPPYSSTSHHAIDTMNNDDVRTFHAGSEYLQNRLSKLSIHSNNDEFVLVGGHPPQQINSSSSIESLNREIPIPRVRSRMSSYSSEKMAASQEELLGKSISQQSLNGSADDRIREQNGHVSRASSRYTVGTSSNTDDRLILAARYSQSPEAEGLIGRDEPDGIHSRRSSSRTSSIDRVGFVEIPTLYSHPDEKFDENNRDEEPGEPFRPTSEHSCTPTSTSRIRAPLVRREALQNSNNDGGFSSSSSSLDPNQPPKALCVTSALTPVIPKRNAPMSLSHSEESLVMKTPQTVQRASSSSQPNRNLRHQNPSEVVIKKTVEMAVQTGNSIRLRQNQHFGDVLSECAYLPEPKGIGMSPTTTTSYIPYSGSTVNIPKAADPPASSDAPIEIPKNSIRARLRHISDIYSTADDDSKQLEIPKNSDDVTSSRRYSEKYVEIPKHSDDVMRYSEAPSKFVEIPKNSEEYSGKYVEIPKHSEDVTRYSNKFVEIPRNAVTSRPTYKKSTEQIVVPIIKPSSIIDIPSNLNKAGDDTIRKHIPRGRIRDLASAFDKMTSGSPARPLEFKSQVHIPKEMTTSKGEDQQQHFWNAKKTIGGEAESNSDIRVGSPMSGSSSSAFRSSTQTIRSQEDRRRSTSSSLHHQPHVFTRNTFLTSSVVKPGDKSNLPSSVAMSTSYSNRAQQDQAAKGDGGFVSAFEKIPSSTHIHDDIAKEISSPTKDSTFSEYSRKVHDVPVRIEVPISGKPQKLRRMAAAAHPRAKTQEIPQGTFEFESRYESRAVSGDLNESNVFGMQKPLFAASREAFGRDTAEDLRAKQDNWPMIRQHQWTSEFQMSESKNTNSVSSPIYHLHDNEIEIPSSYKTSHTLEPVGTRKISHPATPPPPAPSSMSTARRMSMSTVPQRHPYSPPVTEDAGSRITHHTSQTLQSEDFLAGTEDSSIRGKIDRMFDFVESDDSRKTLTHQPHHHNLHHESTETIGTNGINNQSHHNYNQSQQNKYRHNWNNKAAEIPQALKQRQEPKLKSPERRATVTVPELEYFDNGLEYSLTQYREMQREQLRRRLPSADEPQFFRSPTLTAPHAGESLHAYRTKDFLGTPTAGEKFRFPPSSSGLRLAPVALATSTPVDSPTGRQSSFSINRNLSQLDMMNNNNNTNNINIPPNDTFVSSISGVSAADKHADVMKKINRLSYMIENTQKQMSMNEAALLDAVKKGRRSQEIAAHRSILISRETLRLQRSELRRLHAFSAVRRPPPPVAKELRGSVIFKNLIVHLNKLFVQRLTIKDDNSYSFVALFKFGHQVEATELVPLRVYPGEETCDKLFFVKQIQFSDVPVDFMVTIEIFAMRIPAAKPVELSIGTSLANKCKSLMGPPQKKPAVPLETAFKNRGRLVLDRDAQGERCLYLDDVTYPLEGTVMITTQCSRLPESFEIDFRGFLTMFHTISNMASWERYFAVLRRGVVLFWKYPDDEQMGREPKMQIDLTKCTNNSIEKCGFDLCPRANSFVIEILVDAEDEGTIGSVVEKKRVLLSADTSEMLAQWLFTLNQTLDVIRGPI